MLGEKNIWYSTAGNSSDVIISTRVRISRNISGFPFPAQLDNAGGKAVYTAISNFFIAQNDAGTYHTMPFDTLGGVAKKIFEERSVIPAETGNAPYKGIIIRNDGVLSATINIKDHIRLAAFHAGFDIPACFLPVKTTEEQLAEKLPFYAVKDFGYLSSDIYSIGSGIKTSVLCSLPALSLTGSIQESVLELANNHFEVHTYYTQNKKKLLGHLYLISTKGAAGGTDAEQLDHATTAFTALIQKERNKRNILMSEQIWHLQDCITKAFSIAKNALLLDLKDTIDIIAKIKLGINLGFIHGITHEACSTLLYQTQTAHIAFLVLNSTIEFEENFSQEELHIERIRALLVQDALKSAELHVKKTLKL